MSQITHVLALLVPILGLSQSPAHARPEMVCRGTLEGSALITTFQHPNGYRVDGIWTLLVVRPHGPERPRDMFAELLLDTMLEYDARSGRRASIPLAVRLRMDANGADGVEVLRRAVGAWCGTVLRASEEGVYLGRLAERMHLIAI
jgi:hypothetical protein